MNSFRTISRVLVVATMVFVGNAHAINPDDFQKALDSATPVMKGAVIAPVVCLGTKMAYENLVVEQHPLAVAATAGLVAGAATGPVGAFVASSVVLGEYGIAHFAGHKEPAQKIVTMTGITGSTKKQAIVAGLVGVLVAGVLGYFEVLAK